jgi:hypothetical protein
MVPYTYTVKILDAAGKQYRFGNTIWVGENDAPGLAAMEAALSAAERELGPGCRIPHEDEYAVQYHRASDDGMR